MRFFFFFLSICIALSACSLNQESPQTSYYLLDAKPGVVELNANAAPIEVGKIVLPDYLDQSRLVIRGAGQEIIFAAYHRWGDHLDDAIRRVLTRALNEQSPDYRFVPNCQDCEQIDLSIDHFYPTVEGRVILSGIYSIHSPAGEARYHPFFYSEQLERDGYEQSVRQMGALLESLGHEIVSEL